MPKTKRCTYEGGQFCNPSMGVDGCFLCKEVAEQSSKGGQRQPKPERSSNGPYWPRWSWHRFVQRVLAQGEGQCALGNELKRFTNEETGSKSERKEFF